MLARPKDVLTFLFPGFSTKDSVNSKDTENPEDFEGFLNKEKADFSRFMYLLSAVLFLVFGLVDLVAIHSQTNDTVLIRCMVAFGLMFGFYVTTRHPKFFVKHYRLSLAASFIITSSSIQYIINISTPTDYSHTIYFAGLMLIIMSIFAWTFLSILDATLISGFIVGLYVFSAVNINPSPYLETIISHIGNILFLTSSAIIGLMSSLMRNKYLRQNFMLQRSLHEAYKIKAAEAKDNEYLANHDALTGLPNRRYMTELLEDSIKIAAEKDNVLVIMFLDLNGFKQVNDVYGHAAGDKVLKVVAKRLKLAIRSGDHVSRLGGDEYLIGLMMDKNQLDDTENMAEKFTAIIAQSMNIEGIRVSVGTSIGLAAYPIHGNQVSVLIDIADKRMYEAKREKTPVSLETINEKQENKITVIHGSRA